MTIDLLSLTAAVVVVVVAHRRDVRTTRRILSCVSFLRASITDSSSPYSDHCAAPRTISSRERSSTVVVVVDVSFLPRRTLRVDRREISRGRMGRAYVQTGACTRRCRSVVSRDVCDGIHRKSFEDTHASFTPADKSIVVVVVVRLPQQYFSRLTILHVDVIRQRAAIEIIRQATARTSRRNVCVLVLGARQCLRYSIHLHLVNVDG